MKSYQQITLVFFIIGVLGAMVFHGVEGAQQIDPVRQPLTAAELFNLGQQYSRGDEVAQDDDEAAYYYRKAAVKGDARAQLALGMMYANGRGVQKDFDEAVYWMHLSADFAQTAQQDSAVMQMQSWLQKAADFGYAPARRTLARMQERKMSALTNSNNSIVRFRTSSEARGTMTFPKPSSNNPSQAG